MLIITYRLIHSMLNPLKRKLSKKLRSFRSLLPSPLKKHFIRAVRQDHLVKAFAIKTHLSFTVLTIVYIFLFVNFGSSWFNSGLSGYLAGATVILNYVLFLIKMASSYKDFSMKKTTHRYKRLMADKNRSTVQSVS